MRRVVLAFALPALLTPATLRAQGLICDDISSQGAVKLNACLDREYARADSELTMLYSKSLTAVGSDSAQRAALVQSQQAWLVYRDRQRALHEAFAGGENSHGTLMGNMITIVWSRIGFLAEFAKDRYPPDEFTCRYVHLGPAPRIER